MWKGNFYICFLSKSGNVPGSVSFCASYLTSLIVTLCELKLIIFILLHTVIDNNSYHLLVVGKSRKRKFSEQIAN